MVSYGYGTVLDTEEQAEMSKTSPLPLTNKLIGSLTT